MAGVICVGPKPTAASPLVSKTIAITSTQKGRQEQEHAAQNMAVGVRLAQRVEQQQSMALVQIMLHASIGTLFYLREFLPLSCFGERDLLSLSDNSRKVSYEDFVGGKATADDTKVYVKRGQPLKTILRNEDEKADRLLDLLERGVFEALSKNILEAIQLTVLVDKDQPTNVLESYTFSFKYAGDVGDMNSRLASISLDTVGTANMKTFRTARHGLETIIRRLITLSAFLPMLPNKRYMEIHLFYTEDCPSKYEPPGFKAAAHDPLVYPNNENWSKETQSCGNMDSGFHSVGLKVTSLKWTGNDPTESQGRVQIPEDIGYSESVTRDQDVGFDDINDVVMMSQSCSQGSTQARGEMERGKLPKMFVSSVPESDLIQTQANLDSTVLADPIAKPEISQLKITTMRRERDRSPSLNPITTKPKEYRGNASGTLRCDCGLDEIGEDTLKCAICDTLQHMICYGYVNADDSSIPDTHGCYRCLLMPEEPSLLREMETLVLLRRALKVIVEEGYPNRLSHFAQRLNCNGNTIVQITDILKRQGFLQSTPGSKSKGFLSKGLPKFTVPDSLEIREKLRKDIFNPLAKISHHYIVPEGWQTNDVAEGLDTYFKASQSQYGNKRVTWQASGSSSQEAGSFMSSSSSNFAPLTQGMDLDKSANPDANRQSIIRSQDTTASSTRRRQRGSQDEESQCLEVVPGTQGSGNVRAESGTRQRKKRKLSNVARPIDICDPMDEDSS